MTSRTAAEPYTFRPATMAARSELQALPPAVKQGRTILPAEATPSLHTEATERKVDPFISGAKAEFRIHTYFINAMAEIVHQTPLVRGKTSMQGSRAPKGWQAAHAALQPTTRDDHTTALIDHIVHAGVTPRKTKPFLQQRIDLTSPEARELDAHHEDESFVTDFVISRLPKGGASSIFYQTRYSERSNTTFENPDESNQYDTQLERNIGPFLKELQVLRLEGEDSAEISTEKLINWLLDYYKISITNIKDQLANISCAASLFEKMRAFELASLKTDSVSPAEFEIYLNNVSQFLTHHEALIESKKGCPSCAGLKFVRNDFSILRKLRSMAFEQKRPLEEVSAFYLANRTHLKSEMAFDAAFFTEKYSLYLDEAQAQFDATAVFAEPCTIPNLSKMLFGVIEDGVRRAPTADELRHQIYALSTVATPHRRNILAPRNITAELKEPLLLPMGKRKPVMDGLENIDVSIGDDPNALKKCIFEESPSDPKSVASASAPKDERIALEPDDLDHNELAEQKH